MAAGNYHNFNDYYWSSCAAWRDGNEKYLEELKDWRTKDKFILDKPYKPRKEIFGRIIATIIILSPLIILGWILYA